jgi:LysW-gamma-L-lysine carboxypeptidase
MNRDAAIDLVHGLVAIPSLSAAGSGAASWLADQMRAAGFDRSFVDEAGNAIGELGDPSASRTIVLLGHIDTVPGNIPSALITICCTGEGVSTPRGPWRLLLPELPVSAHRRLAPRISGSSWSARLKRGGYEQGRAIHRRPVFWRQRSDSDRLHHRRAEPLESRHARLQGRLLLDFTADQPMAHTAGPDASVASVVVDYWNWVTAHAARVNEGKDKVFDQLSPSLRRFITSTNDQMHDIVDAQFAWRLPVGFDAEAFMKELEAQANRSTANRPTGRIQLKFRGYEKAWRGDRNNPLVRSFLAGLRSVEAAEKLGFV